MISDNEFLVNFDENFQFEETLFTDHLILLEDTAKAFESLNLEAQSLIKNSFDVGKVKSLKIN